MSLAGDLPKQVKVKKLSKLKTMDTKPGDLMSAVSLVVLCRCVLTHNDFLSAGIYTAYRTFLHKDKILIKRLLKVSSRQDRCGRRNDSNRK